MSIAGPTVAPWVHRFKPGDYVEVERCPGAVFKVMENTRDYDGHALVEIRFVGPRRGIPPRSKGRLNKHFRIKTLCAEDRALTPANPMLVIAAEAGG